ncbi:MAG TPA: hypothetical protein VHM24_14460 [Gemmatimonadaceae bacterium]|nr:hypothetical protein [Gemmatimonadaceae bacterium]
MTETGNGDAPVWVPVLLELSRTAGHDLRNALNGLVVSLEVVRSRSDRLDPQVQPFVAQAVDQSEESVRLAEGSIALLHLVLSAVDSDGALRIHGEPGHGVRIESTEEEAVRAVKALGPFTARSAVTAEMRDASVILRVLDKAGETEESND